MPRPAIDFNVHHKRPFIRRYFPSLTSSIFSLLLSLHPKPLRTPLVCANRPLPNHPFVTPSFLPYPFCTSWSSQPSRTPSPTRQQNFWTSTRNETTSKTPLRFPLFHSLLNFYALLARGHICGRREDDPHPSHGLAPHCATDQPVFPPPFFFPWDC
ncbi:hypothetical protein K469DRAFT_103996 [Zopfia rhizophila CBS 207.26]|uniref:Uncharacterized protein n=1 Tax=Zopfia rhizophila CBS 207.26 TaxID=1314779 RepID=A0A6A6EBZ6_9PEZI|nr:hypothetical protein K469DRAFT_103996 [Zopfia rhizophila CBS 207.26]